MMGGRECNIAATFVNMNGTSPGDIIEILHNVTQSIVVTKIFQT